jgi:hypothetical protein
VSVHGRAAQGKKQGARFYAAGVAAERGYGYRIITMQMMVSDR